MRNCRRFRCLYFEDISVDEIEETSLGIRVWAEARNVIPSGLDLAGTEWEPMIEDVDPVETTTFKHIVGGS